MHLIFLKVLHNFLMKLGSHLTSSVFSNTFNVHVSLFRIVT